MTDEDARAIAAAAIAGKWTYVQDVLKQAETPHEIWALKNTFEQLANACEGEYRDRVLS